MPDSTPALDPIAPTPVPLVRAPWVALFLAGGMFVLIPIALVLFAMDRPHVREAMDATGSFLGGIGGWGALILSLVLCVLQTHRERRPQ